MNPEVAEYNDELFFKFFDLTRKQIETLPSSLREDRTQSVDLLKSINSFRSYRTKEALLKQYPDLIVQEQYIDILWAHFSGKSEEQLSDLAIEMIHEVSF